MSILRAAAIATLVVAGSWAQCNCTSVAGCEAYFSGGTPPLTTWVPDTCASFAAIQATFAGQPMPPIVMTALNVPASGYWLGQSMTVFGGAVNSYMDHLRTDVGITEDFVSLSVTAFSCAPGYAAYANAFASPINIGCDCAGGSPLPLNGSVPAGSGIHCKQRAVYDSMVAHAGSTGVSLDTAFFPSAEAVSASGLVPATATWQQYEAFLIPLEQAAMALYGSKFATYIQVFGEPTAFMASWGNFACGTSLSPQGTTTCVQNVSRVIDDSSAAIKAIQPTTKIGAAAIITDYHYWSAWQVDPNIDVGYLDIFQSQCDPSNNSYATFMATTKSTFVATGKKVMRIGQTQPPIYCATGQTPNEQNAIVGDLDALWTDYCPTPTTCYTDLQSRSQTLINQWASVNGLQASTLFFTLPWFYTTFDQSNNNSITGTASTLAMSQLKAQDSARNMKILNTWQFGSRMAGVKFSGVVLP